MSQAYVNGDDVTGSAADEEWVSNLCDIGAHTWCADHGCVCACHKAEADDEPA